MRIEVGDDALDGGLVERGLGNGVDVFAPDAADHLVEQPMPRRIGGGGFASGRRGGGGLRAQHARQARGPVADGCASDERQEDGGTETHGDVAVRILLGRAW